MGWITAAVLLAVMLIHTVPQRSCSRVFQLKLLSITLSNFYVIKWPMHSESESTPYDEPPWCVPQYGSEAWWYAHHDRRHDVRPYQLLPMKRHDNQRLLTKFKQHLLDTAYHQDILIGAPTADSLSLKRSSNWDSWSYMLEKLTATSESLASSSFHPGWDFMLETCSPKPTRATLLSHKQRASADMQVSHTICILNLQLKFITYLSYLVAFFLFLPQWPAKAKQNVMYIYLCYSPTC